MESNDHLSQVGFEILQSARTELAMQLPYLQSALGALTLRPGEETTQTLSTNGEILYFSGNFLTERFLRSPALVNRGYFHVLLHCMLRHLHPRQDRDDVLWDLACDIAVESILDDLHYPCLAGSIAPSRGLLYGKLRGQMKVLTAQGIYASLLRDTPDAFTLAQYQRTFHVDEHTLWSPKNKDQQEQTQRQSQAWGDRSEHTQTAMETVLSASASGGEAVLEQVRVANRDDVDYRNFLRRFAQMREVLSVDADAFDYGFYSYGLSLYGNLPLIEPLETKEERRIQEFVIAIDTSMSTSGEMVRQFLACTYSALRSVETFTHKVHIRILQCDDQVRSDLVVEDLDQLGQYMDNFQLTGGSATDFRPVFDHVATLQATGVLPHLQGLVYFTDGMGIYPSKPTGYDVAFVFLEQPPLSVDIPPWCMRLTLSEWEFL